MNAPIKLKPKEREHYVSNKDLYAAYIAWYKEVDAAEAAEQEPPQMPKFIAESIIKISTRLAYKPNFFNYSYRDEMIADAIENNIRTVRNFNPAKSANPFSFITTIAYNAFLRRIEAEKKQSYVKSQLITQIPIHELMECNHHDEEAQQMQNQYIDYLRENNFLNHQEALAVRKRKAAKLAEDSPLEQLMGEVPKDE